MAKAKLSKIMSQAMLVGDKQNQPTDNPHPVVTEFLLGFCGFRCLSGADLTGDSVWTTLSVILLFFAAEESDFLVVVLLQEIYVCIVL